jgi:multiple sugar transport system permease protein
MTRLEAKKTTGAKGLIFSYVRHIPVLLWVVIVLFPLLMLLFASFKTNAEYANTLPITPPENFLNFENFKRTLIEGRILKGMLNSLILVAAASVLNVLFSSMVAFCLDRFHFTAKKYVTLILMATAVIPNSLIIVSVYKIMYTLKLTGTFGAPVILYAIPQMIQVWIYLQFLERVSVSLDESAMLDGASYVRIFFQIIFPLLAPATVTVIITQSVFIYNDLFIQYLFMSSSKLQTATTALMTFSGQFNFNFNTMAAGCIGVMLPTLVIFLSLQKYIFAGLTVGAVKG